MSEIPLRLVEDEEGLFLPYVRVTVDGRPLELLLDSGAARTRIPAAAGMRTRPVEPDEAGHTAFGSPRRDREGPVRLELGGHTLDLTAIVTDDGMPDVGGLLGQDVLGRFCCRYDLSEALVVLGAGEDEYGDDVAEWQPVDIGERGHVWLDLRWDAIRATGVFDTGASITVVDARFADRHPTLFRSAGASAGIDASGASVQTPLARMRGPRVLGADLDDSLVALVDLEPVNATLARAMDVIVGWPLLSQATWDIDHPRRRARLHREQEPLVEG